MSAGESAKPKRSLGEAILAGVGSYGLCCLCLIAMFVLTLFGTLHQRDHGLYDAKEKFFNSWFLWYEVGGFSLPVFPGGVTTMWVLTINLIVGGLLRIHWQARNAGIIIIHFGIIFLMLSSLIKLDHSEEGHLTLWERDFPSTAYPDDRSDIFKSYTKWEVAIWEMTGKMEGTEFVIPDEHLKDLAGDARRTFTNASLPFELKLSGFVENCDVLPKGPQWKATGEVIDGYGILSLPPSKESEQDIAGIHAEVIVGGVSQRGILYGVQREPWVIDVQGRLFAIDLRHTRYPMPFEIRLKKFIKEDHPGISMAKAYRSEVTKVDASGEENVWIQMNEPLRDGGLVLFQSSWGPQNGTKGPFYSVFSVVRNPSDKWPEYSMWVITLGLLITFIRTLLRFSRKQAEERKKLSANPS